MKDYYWKWYVSDVLDDGHFGIVNERDEIIIGANSPLSEEQATKIVEMHNREFMQESV